MSATRERIAKGSVSLLWALAGIALIAIMWELTKFVGTLIELPFNTSDHETPECQSERVTRGRDHCLENRSL